MVEDVWEKVGVDLPDGEYEGTWCGRTLEWNIGDRCFRAEMPKAIRGRIECVVLIECLEECQKRYDSAMEGITIK